ncbi:MAG: hypothetical protein ABI398_06600 [Devosia sp.]
MLKISKAALVAAVLSLSTIPTIGVVSALAQDTTTTTTTGFTTKLSIPTITAVASTMDDSALRDALTGGFMKHVDEIAKLSATSITIPEISLTMSVTTGDAPVTSTMTYKDIVLTDVKDGVAASASVGSAETSTAEGSFKFGKMSTSTLDFGGILGLYSLVPNGGADQPMKVLYKDFAFEGGSFGGPKANCTFGKVIAAEFDARPLKVSFAALMEASQKMSASKDNPPPEAVATFVGFMADMFQAFKSEPLHMDGLSCSGTGDNDKPFELKIGGVTMDGYSPGIYPAITLNDLKISDGGADSITLAEASIKSIDLSAPIKVVEEQGSNLDPAWVEKNYRKLIPAFGGFSLSGLAIDIPDPDKPGERINANIAKFDVSLSDYLNGIPTKIATSASGVEVPLPASSEDDNVKMLLALGITKVNLGYEIAANWDKASQTINLTKVSVSGEDLGGFAVATVIGNAAEQLFDPDNNVALAAAMGVTIKSITINAADAGIGDKLVPMLAAQQNADPANFRSQMAGVAEGAALQMLGSTDAARQLGVAVGDFIGGKAKALTINVVAKDPSGIPVPVLMQASNDPTTLTQAVDITGSAQ